VIKNTENTVYLKGFVGDYSNIPDDVDTPARFDIVTSERLKTVEGEVISTHDWHTIVTPDHAFVRDNAKPGTLIEVWGRISSRKVRFGRQVEVIARELNVTERSKIKRERGNYGTTEG
jgi:hypothetical protein